MVQPFLLEPHRRRSRFVKELSSEVTPMAQWMVLKVVGMILEGKIEQERTLSLESTDEETQDLSEFVEDKFIQLYGIRK
ncbi:MAG: hypothetical protein SGPRY_011314, partial [Prymnesium sp.]